MTISDERVERATRLDGKKPRVRLTPSFLLLSTSIATRQVTLPLKKAERQFIRVRGA
jgi:hypothetical protein